MRLSPEMNRRGFLKAAGGLVVAIAAPARLAGHTTENGAEGRLGAFIRILADGQVELTVPTFEIGQGAHTSLAMILCDELGADWAAVRVLAPLLNPEMNTPGWQQQIVAGSFSVRLWYQPLRQAAAAAREMLTEVAAADWGVPVAECTALRGAVVHAASGRQAPFSALVDRAAALPVPGEPALRPDLTLVGRSVPRVDLPAKVDGSAVFGVDVRLPGMVYAAIRQAPVYGAAVQSVDRDAIAGRPGVMDVVEMPEAVMVIASTFWAAKQAIEAMEITFAATAADSVTTADIMAAQTARLGDPDAGIGVNEGDAPGILDAAEASGLTVVQADYSVPFLYHATMEPMTCTVSVSEGRCDIWVPSQDITSAAAVAARITGLPPERITVYATYAGGGFGRKFEQDFVAQAVTAAMAVGRPVQLVWTREEDVQHGFYRPAVSARLTGAADTDGAVRAFRMRLVGHSVIEHSFGVALLDGVDPVTLLGVSTETGSAPGKIQQYSIANALVDYIHQPSHVPVGYWRSVGASHNGFFIEGLVDELAAAVGAEPLAFRRALLRESPRGLAVIDRVAAESGWDSPPAEGRHRGIAFAEAVGSLVGYVAEISMERGAPKVHRITVAIDCGLAVNPDSVVAQVQGGVIMALNAALHEEILIEDGRCVQGNFHDYALMDLAATPVIDVHIVASGAPPGGVGEAALPGVAPAVANAIFAATGARIRSLPIMRHI